MDVVSLGHRTDIALLRLGGSKVEDRVYRSVGFVDGERQLQAARRPT